MELVCEKYKGKFVSMKAVCRRPKEYCKFRSACLIHFLAREKSGGENAKAEDVNGEDSPMLSGVLGEL